MERKKKTESRVSLPADRPTDRRTVTRAVYSRVVDRKGDRRSTRKGMEREEKGGWTNKGINVEKRRIQVAGDAVELAECGGAIGSRGCGGRRGRGRTISRGCSARPYTEGGGETKVQTRPSTIFPSTTFAALPVITRAFPLFLQILPRVDPPLLLPLPPTQYPHRTRAPIYFLFLFIISFDLVCNLSFFFFFMSDGTRTKHRIFR